MIDAVEAEIRRGTDAHDFRGAATAAIRGYGDELLGYLTALTRDETTASDAFALACENLWAGLPGFRWDCPCRAWAYGLARNALARVARDPYRRRKIAIDDAEVAAIAEAQRTRTALFLQTDVKDKLAQVRASLDPDDHTLLILRLDRQLAWRDIARVIDGGDADVDRRAAALRKRFARLKDELRERLSQLDRDPSTGM